MPLFREDWESGQTGRIQLEIHTGMALNSWYFAKTDGVSPANPDNTTALQNAMNNAAAAGRVLVLPSGRLAYSSVTVPLTLRGILGYGAILDPSANGLVFDTTNGSYVRTFVEGVEIDGGQIGISCVGNNVLTLARFDDLYIHSQSHASMKITCEAHRLGFRNVDLENADYGLWATNEFVRAAILFESGAISNHRESGVYMEGMSGHTCVKFQSVTLEGNRKYAVRMHRAQNITFDSCQFEANNFSKGGHCDILLEQAGSYFPTQNIQFISCRTHYDLTLQQPQIFIRCAAPINELLLQNTQIMYYDRVRGCYIETGGSVLNLVNTHIPADHIL